MHYFETMKMIEENKLIFRPNLLIMRIYFEKVNSMRNPYNDQLNNRNSKSKKKRNSNLRHVIKPNKSNEAILHFTLQQF